MSATLKGQRGKGGGGIGPEETLLSVEHGEATPTVPFDPKPDGPRYAACGDAITVNVAEWIGGRLREAEEGRVAA